MPSPERRKLSKSEIASAAEKIQALLPALNYSLGLLKEGYSTSDFAKEEVAMTEINVLFDQIVHYAEHLEGPAGKKYQTRLRNFNGDLHQLVKDLKNKNTSGITKDFSHLTKDVDALRQLA